MADPVVSSVGQTIGKLLIDEAKFLWRVEGKVEDLQKELELTQDLLRDADTRKGSEPAVVAQLRDVAYDAEDVIERYFLKVESKKEQNVIKAYACFVAKCMCMQSHKLGTEIDGLKSSISNLSSNLRTRMLVLGIKPVNEGERERARALTPKHTYAHFEEDIVGREDSLKALVEELLKDGEQHRVVSIWGMGGLGKTTLAKRVFAHKEVKKHFQGFAWACVSQKYIMKDILIDILVGLIPDQSESVVQMRENQLLETLYNTQQDKRCIVVLDDIWTEQAWDKIQAAFSFKNTESKLLITTRNKEVAEYIDRHGFLHEPQCLSDQKSWELLKKRVFPKTKTVGLSSVGPRVGQGITAGQAIEGQISEIPVEMKNLGDDLLKKCEGLPLAIIVLGGLLAIKEWKTVHENIEKWKTVHDNINLHFSDKSHVSLVLELSYDDLPLHLKSCFLYLGSFPIDKPIPPEKILHMWIAEGFVSPDTYEGREITVEDVARQYLMELVNRGMVQARFSLSGKIKTCRLHDRMRHFCIEKARKEGFLRNLRDDEMEKCSSSIEKEVKSTCKIRRLSLSIEVGAERNTIPRVEPIQTKMLHLRTLLFFNSRKSLTGTWAQFQPIFINYKFLRVLNLEGFHNMTGNLPESVGDLVHLRYLSLAGCMLKDLPQSMGNLVCMEYLDLCGQKTSRVIVPNVLWKMIRLRNLHLPSYFVVNGKEKLQLHSLKNLWSLKNLHPECCDVNDLDRLTNLRKLTVSFLYRPDLKIISQVAKFPLKHLESSSFGFSSRDHSFTEDDMSEMSNYCYSCKLFMNGKIEKLPEHKHLPQQLRKLNLILSQLEEDPMPTLEKLDHLVVLKLGDRAFEGKEMVCSARGFPQLKHLVLQGLQNLEKWTVVRGAMTHLSLLQIGYCSKLKKSAHVTVLEMFSLIGSVVTWEEETGEQGGPWMFPKSGEKEDEEHEKRTRLLTRMTERKNRRGRRGDIDLMRENSNNEV